MHYFKSSKYILFILVLFCISSLQASPDYREWVTDIENRLDKTALLYQEKKLMMLKLKYKWRISKYLKT